MRKGFTIIEILIAMLILFIAIVFINMSIKTFNNYQRKSEIYQNFYITALSLKDKMNIEDFDKGDYKGTLNDIDYFITIKEIIRKKNYIIDFDIGGGNNGDFFIILYKLNMRLQYKNIIREYSFYITKQKRIHPLIKIEGKKNE